MSKNNCCSSRSNRSEKDQKKIMVARRFLQTPSELQELIQRTPGRTITYQLVEETGPDHCRVFVMEVSVDGQVSGRGEGRSKKEAEQAAAKAALKLLGGE